MQNRTRNWMHSSLAAAVLCALSVPVVAQTPATPAPDAPAARQARGGRRATLQLVTVPVAVMDMISPLKDDQKTKIQVIADKEKTDAAAAVGRPAKTEVATKASDEIKALLTPEQTSAVEKATPMLTMLNSSRVIPLAALPDVKLTKDQMDKINALTEQELAKVKGLKGTERTAKMTEVNADFKTQVEALLTADQKTAIAKYETAHPRRQRNAAPPAA